MGKQGENRLRGNLRQLQELETKLGDDGGDGGDGGVPAGARVRQLWACCLSSVVVLGVLVAG